MVIGNYLIEYRPKDGPYWFLHYTGGWIFEYSLHLGRVLIMKFIFRPLNLKRRYWLKPIPFRLKVLKFLFRL